MLAAAVEPPDHLIFATPLVRIGAFRCPPDHARFKDSGPIREKCCFVFPRTAVEIQHEHAHPFAANPNVVTFYNRGQAYRRRAISARGDLGDWFAVEPSIAAELVREVRPGKPPDEAAPFPFVRGFSNPAAYLEQRMIFELVSSPARVLPIAVEEAVLLLLERVLGEGRFRAESAPRAAGQEAERILSRYWDRNLSLRDLAEATGVPVFPLCRAFRRATGTTMHRYLRALRVRSTLERVAESAEPLTEIALDAGFSSHSHFTRCFREEFGATPSAVRAGLART